MTAGLQGQLFHDINLKCLNIKMNTSKKEEEKKEQGKRKKHQALK